MKKEYLLQKKIQKMFYFALLFIWAGTIIAAMALS